MTQKLDLITSDMAGKQQPLGTVLSGGKCYFWEKGDQEGNKPIQTRPVHWQGLEKTYSSGPKVPRKSGSPELIYC